MEPYAEITPQELAARLAAESAPTLLDVREPWEHAICALAGARLIPMEELPQRLHELDRGAEIVVYCHHGVRSAMVVQWLRAQAVPARNLRGGIDAWAVDVDPGLPRY
jgi:rhodanese-related sulfurtransferase